MNPGSALGPAPEPAPGLVIEAADLAFDDRPVLRSLSLHIKPGGWHALLGRVGLGERGDAFPEPLSR